ncbi:MAG: cache domain-containing protein, partial [Gammaproteobacteria bacterium]
MAWPGWLAWGAAGLMAAAMMLLVVIRQPNAAAWLRLLFLRAPTLRGRLLVGCSFVALVPVLTLPPILGMNSASFLQKEQVAGLEGLVQTVADGLPGMVAKRIDGINVLARHISAVGDYGDAALVDWLLRHHEANAEIVSMWIARPDGHVAVATAARNDSAERWGGPIAGVGVMDYFQAALEHGGEYVSTVRKGVAAGFKPMVFISAPVGPAGEAPWGYLQAQLDLSRVFGHFVMQDARAGSEILMIDAQNRVMLSSPRLKFRQFEDISGHPLFAAMNRDVGKTSFNFSGAIRSSGEDGRYVAAVRELPRGWRVMAVASQDSAQTLVVMPLLLGGVWVLLTVLLARGFASLFSEAVAQPLKKLDESLDVFDAERTISIIPQAPSDAPSEVQDVYKKVRDSMRKSRDAYRNMMRALSEGAELKRQLQEVSGGGAHTGAIGVVEAPPEDTSVDVTSTSRGR